MRAYMRYGVALMLIAASAACSGGRPDEQADNSAAAATVAQDVFAKGFEEQAKGGQAPPAASRETGYTHDPAARRKIEREFADALSRNFSLEFMIADPQEFMRSGAAGEIADRKIEALGLPSHDVAAATVLMFGLGWELANGQKLTPDRQKALLTFFDRKFAEEPVRESQRQTETDYRLLTAGLWLEEARLRRNSPEQMQALSDAIHRDMKRMTNNDMRAHDVTEKGFVER